MRRMRELINRVQATHPEDTFFNGVDDSLRTLSQARAYYRAYDRALELLDEKSWQQLSIKAISHFQNHRQGQLKQGFFNQLNEAFAYQYLVRRGFTDVKVLAERSTKTPDLEYRDRKKQRFCEVKTIGISENEIFRRSSSSYSTHDYKELSKEFRMKLESDLRHAYSQITAMDGDGIVFVLINFDDVGLVHYERYREQLANWLSEHEVPEIFIKVGIIGGKKLHKVRI